MQARGIPARRQVIQPVMLIPSCVTPCRNSSSELPDLPEDHLDLRLSRRNGKILLISSQGASTWPYSSARVFSRSSPAHYFVFVIVIGVRVTHYSSLIFSIPELLGWYCDFSHCFPGWYAGFFSNCFHVKIMLLLSYIIVNIFFSHKYGLANMFK